MCLQSITRPSRVTWGARPRPASEVQLSAAHACALRVQNDCPSTDVRREVLPDHLPTNIAGSLVVPNARTVRRELARAACFPLDISGPAQGPHAPMSSRLHPQLGPLLREGGTTRGRLKSRAHHLRGECCHLRSRLVGERPAQATLQAKPKDKRERAP